MDFSRQVFIDYFSESLSDLEKDYNWAIPSSLAFEGKGNNFKDNVDFKYHLHECWKAGSHDDRLLIANEIVSVWGGVRNNKAQTLEEYVVKYSKPERSYPLRGVASYSKILSIISPEEYAIYDARVAVSLNAIQYLYGTDRGIVFNYIPGRNNITGHAGKKTGFVYTSPFRQRDLKNRGWSPIKRDHTYETFLKVMNDVLSSFPERKIYELEMCLFANAEKLAGAAIEKSRS